MVIRMLKVNDVVNNGIESGIVKKVNKDSYKIVWQNGFNKGCSGNYSKEYLIIKGFIK